jgi:hypothetical protein
MTDPRAEDRRRFRKTLVRVMAMQLAALAILWTLQVVFTP